MFLGRQLGSFIIRGIHTSVPSFDKQLLSKLRKKTGYPFINCKKALQQFNNDLQQAEAWLKQEAEKEGWHKATKLQNRPMSQGLIGFTQQNNMASIVEVNCETDFVAMNVEFKGLVAQALEAVMEKGKSQASNKLSLQPEDLNHLPVADKALKEWCVLKVADLGENISIRRGIFLRALSHQSISHYIHSIGPKKQLNPNTNVDHSTTSSHDNCVFGKYGAVLLSEVYPTLEVEKDGEKDSVDEGDTALDKSILVRQICQHIVGMNPSSIGNIEEPEKVESDEKVEENVENVTVKVDNATKNVETSKIESKDDLDAIKDSDEKEEEEKDEVTLMDQKFIMDDKVRVREVLKREGVVVVDYVRMACGEEIEEVGVIDEKKENVASN